MEFCVLRDVHTRTRTHACMHPSLPSGVPGPLAGGVWAGVGVGASSPRRKSLSRGLGFGTATRNSGPIAEPYLPPSPFRFCFRGCYHCGSGERHNFTLSGKIKFKEAKGNVRIRTCEDQRASSGWGREATSTVLTKTTFSRK